MRNLVGVIFVTGLNLCTGVMAADYCDPTHVHTSGPGNFDFGRSLAPAGDVNADGVPDYIVGEWKRSRAVIFSGSDFSIIHDIESTESYFGWSVSAAGDVNNDGFSDVIIGAARTGFDVDGYAAIYSGQSGLLLLEFRTLDPTDRFGMAVSSLGDIDGDNFPEVIIGASPALSSGKAYVFSTNPLLAESPIYIFKGDGVRDFFGRQVTGLGDISGDGIADILIGAPLRSPSGSIHEGRAVVYSGSDGSLLYEFLGESRSDLFGSSVASLGDLNNDGFGEFIIGASSNKGACNNVGKAYVYSGVDGSLMYKYEGDRCHEHLGADVSGTGDIDGDGISDFLIGTTISECNIFSGATGVRIGVLSTDSIGDNFGLAVAGIGDLNADGVSDVLVGAENIGDGEAHVFILVDSDSDGILDCFDNCIDVSNPSQTDIDNDGMGDSCDICPNDSLNDADEDGVCEDVDNCDIIYNPLQVDTDGDGVGDSCDNCPAQSNADQIDVDFDGIGDSCDVCPTDVDNDIDGDGLCANVDNCPISYNPEQIDSDGDGVGDPCDQCPGFEDYLDWDWDGVPDSCDVCPGYDDMIDSDGDSVPDGCDVCPGFDDMNDSDGDSVPDECDICPGHDDLSDSDGDFIPDGCDICLVGNDSLDSDSDGVPDGCDACSGFNDSLDTDGDSVPDSCDVCDGFNDLEDIDGDAIPDSCDTCPENAASPCCCTTAGDGNNDGEFNIADVTFLIARIFAGGDQPICTDQADTNGDNSVNISDVTFSIVRIFGGGVVPICGTTGT